MKHMTKEQAGEERAYWVYASTALFIIKGSQDRTSNRARAWRLEPIQRPWRVLLIVLPWLAQPAFLWSPRSPARDGTTHNRLGPPHQSLIKKMLYRLAYSPIIWRHFLNRGFLLSDGDSLCQVDINQASPGRM